jgi:CHAT domain
MELSKENIDFLRSLFVDSKDLLLRNFPATLKFPFELAAELLLPHISGRDITLRYLSGGYTEATVLLVRPADHQPFVIKFGPLNAMEEHNKHLSDNLPFYIRPQRLGTPFQSKDRKYESFAYTWAGGNYAAPQLREAIPDDCLFLLPLEVLSPRASAGEYPLLEIPTTYFPSASALVLARAQKSSRDWDAALFAIGNPVTVDTAANPHSLSTDSSFQATENNLRSRGLSLDPIPGTETEIKEIAKLFPAATRTEIRLGPAATKGGFVHTDLSRFRFLHFATHGLLPTESNLLEPALVFSKDGTEDIFLQLSEVLTLRLNADSVVLSACNTGSGDVSKAEGVANLGRAFLLAGSSSATVSLWQVSDDSTVLLMRRYYEGLLSGEPKPDALAKARKAVWKAGYDNPFFWAAFVLMSD